MNSKGKYINVITLFMSLMLSGCASVMNEDNSGVPESVICPEERPEICTMQYEPVCAKLMNNTLQTYSNSCSACADKQAIAYQHGECK